MRILSVEDDLLMVRLLQRFCDDKEWSFFHSFGAQLLKDIANFKPDIVLLDWNLKSEKDGIEQLFQLRASQFHDVPVIMLSGRQGPENRVKGLTSGADDYIEKPFNLHELEARISAVLRRGILVEPSYCDSYLEIHIAERRLLVGGEEKRLTLQEWTLLSALLRNSRTLPRDELMLSLWGADPRMSVRSLDVAMSRLRKLIQPSRYGHRYLQSVRGVGYTFVRPSELEEFE